MQQKPLFFEQPQDLRARRRDAQAGEVRDLGRDPAVRQQDAAVGEVVLRVPGGVGAVAERGAQNGAGALFGVRLFVREDRDLEIVERDPRGFADEPAVARVLGVDEQADAAEQQLGPRRRDLDRLAAAEERQVVERRLAVGGFQLRLRDRGAAFGAPEDRRFFEVGLIHADELEEFLLRELLDRRADRAVLQVPVGRKAERFPEIAELLFVARARLAAERDEIAARHVGGADALLALDEALGRQAVVVEAEGVKDVFALHPVEPRNDLGLREREQVPDVQAAADGRGRRVDRVDRGFRVGVEPVDFVFAPEGLRLLFNVREVVELFHASASFPGKISTGYKKSPKQHKLYCLGRTLSVVPPNFRGSLCTLPVRDSALSDTVFRMTVEIPLKSTEGAAPRSVHSLEVTFRVRSRELTPAAPSLRIPSRVLFLVNAFDVFGSYFAL